ncbi:four helix bundle protein [Anaerolineae bacterium CFX7]|nr:four helix bundle protein [Anaerolineae bacterium CFX7]
MAVQPLEEIEIFKLAEAIADKWWEIVSEWSVFSQDTVGKQLIRAVDSIGANIAESYGRYHFGEKKSLVLRAWFTLRSKIFRATRAQAQVG